MSELLNIGNRRCNVNASKCTFKWDQISLYIMLGFTFLCYTYNIMWLFL